ncbi:MAG TPA: hypothetical protein PLK94_06085 [Alphaproteobacteria bacterium]|nr:hypothetical protein [Alphaproteobacteria bacterium]HOO50841.1 hypothetical protein [Alphaproteobacteria bacterium]
MTATDGFCITRPNFTSVFGQAAKGALEKRDALIAIAVCKTLSRLNTYLSNDSFESFAAKLQAKIKESRENDKDFTLNLRVLKENGNPEANEVQERVAEVFEGILLIAHRNIAIAPTLELIKSLDIELDWAERNEICSAIDKVNLREPDTLFPTVATLQEVRRQTPNC